MNCAYGSWQDFRWREIRTREEEETKREHLRRRLAPGPPRRHERYGGDKWDGPDQSHRRRGRRFGLDLGVRIRGDLPGRRLELLEAGMSIHPIALIERLELLVCMTSNAMWFGMLLLIRAQEGEPVWPSGVGWLGAEAVLTGGGVRDIRGGERWQGRPSFFYPAHQTIVWQYYE